MFVRLAVVLLPAALKRQRKLNGSGLPVAAAVKVTGAPCKTVDPCGCCVNTGVTSTTRATVTLVVDTRLETITVWLPLWLADTLVSRRPGPVAPGMGTPFKRHSYTSGVEPVA